MKLTLTNLKKHLKKHTTLNIGDYVIKTEYDDEYKYIFVVYRETDLKNWLFKSKFKCGVVEQFSYDSSL